MEAMIYKQRTSEVKKKKPNKTIRDKSQQIIIVLVYKILLS